MIDVGNSTIIFGVFIDGKLTQSFIVKSDIDHVAKLRDILNDFIVDKHINISDFKGGLICSVVSSYNRNIFNAIKDTFKIEVQIMDHSFVNDVEINVDNRQEVGLDLIADVVYAKANKLYPCLIVDMGTISKFIAIDKDGKFDGVSFIPGVEVGFDIMRNSTFALPLSELLKKPSKAFGNNTLEALNSGMYYATIGSINEFVNQFENKYGKHNKILTGGISPIFVGDFPDFVHDKNLTLKGIYEIYKNN